MLLLVVLSMLTLFMLLGITYVVTASRARTTARAFAKLSAGVAEARLPTEHLLEESALLLLRGRRDPLLSGREPVSLSTSGTTHALQFESLLVDQYGNEPPLEGTVSAAEVAGPFCTLTVTLGSESQAPPSPLPFAHLSGRILTLRPKQGGATSHPILRAEPSGADRLRLCIGTLGPPIERPGAGLAFQAPPAGTPFLVNGRPHAGVATLNEAWDAYDFPANAFLAHVEPDPEQPARSKVIRTSMFRIEATPPLHDDDPTNDDLDGDGVDDRADNDNDGVHDGWFFDPGFATIRGADGLPIRVDISCLILDMDGRLNVNAHGSIRDLVSFSSPLPFGSGYGTAEINGATVFRTLADSSADPASDHPWLNILLGGRTPETLFSASAPRPGERLQPLKYAVGQEIEGRYGWRANDNPEPISTSDTLADLVTRVPLPGRNGEDDPASKDNEAGLLAVPEGNRGWAIDLQGRLQTFATATGGPVPSLAYAKADTSSEFQDDPYELQLDYDRRRTELNDPRTAGRGPSPIPDNPFSPVELERILRPYDDDTMLLPQRMAALLGSQAEATRLVVTSDSWDTASLLGDAARRIYDFFAAIPPDLLHEHFPEGAWNAVADGTRPPNNLLPAEFAAGLRMDITRPVEGRRGQRRLFFKDLYMAAVALSTLPGMNPQPDIAAHCAQWAANVIEYQDADSTMSRYEYDTEPLDGWDVDGDPTTKDTDAATVWGAERPEVVITQTLAWEDADAKQGELFVVLHHPWDARFNGGPAGSAEPVDANLRGATPDAVDLGRRVSGDPIWRLRCGGTFPFPQGKSSLKANQWMFVKPDGPSAKGFQAAPEPGTSAIVAPIAGCRATLPEADPAALDPRKTSVTLERLADPTLPHDATTNPYLIIDALAVFVADLRPDPPAPGEDGGENGDGADDTSSPKDSDDAPAANPLQKRNKTPTACKRSNAWVQQEEERPFQKNETPAVTAAWDGAPPWMMWPNRPITSPVELIFVPGFGTFRVRDESSTDGKGMLADYFTPTDDGIYLPDIIPGDRMLALDVFTVPSRFAGVRHTIDRTADYWDAVKGLRVGFYGSAGAEHLSPAEFNQIAAGREPGRVNINTIQSDAVWEAVVQGSVRRDPDPARSKRPPFGLVKARTSGTKAADIGYAELASSGTAGTLHPAKSTPQLLNLSGNDGIKPLIIRNDAVSIPDANLNPMHEYHTALRLGNIATNRSHVFGIWITLRTIPTTGTTTGAGTPAPIDRDAIRYHRMFLLYDRSIPVGFAPGHDHNVRDGILLQRVIR